MLDSGLVDDVGCASGEPGKIRGFEPDAQRQRDAFAFRSEDLGGESGIHSRGEEIEVRGRREQGMVLSRWKREQVSGGGFDHAVADAERRRSGDDQVHFGLDVKVAGSAAADRLRVLPDVRARSTLRREEALEENALSHARENQRYNAAAPRARPRTTTALRSAESSQEMRTRERRPSYMKP